MFGGISFLVVGCILGFLAVVLFVASDKNEPIEENKLPALIDWSFLLAVIAIFCLLSEFLTFTTVFLIMTLITGIAFVAFYFLRKGKSEIIESLSLWHVVEYLKGFFWIFLIIFVVRAFIVDLSVIPSSSMRPGLVVGDFVLVNKYHYGLKTPITNNTIIENNKVQKGDVIVFNFPLNEKVQFVKRVVAIPGDKVIFKDKNLYINDQEIAKKSLGMTSYIENSYNVKTPFVKKVALYEQNLGVKTFNIYEVVNQPEYVGEVLKKEDSCIINESENYLECTLPKGKYLVLGDNRDNSEDGRYWGYVDEKDILGNAFFIWMNFKDFKRIGTIIK